MKFPELREMNLPGFFFRTEKHLLNVVNTRYEIIGRKAKQSVWYRAPRACGDATGNLKINLNSVIKYKFAIKKSAG